MKVCSLIIFIVVYMLPVAVFGQTEDDKRFAGTNTNVQYIKLTHPKEKIRINLPVSSLYVYDARFDTTSVGLTQTYLVLTPYQFKNQFTKEIHHYLSSLIQTDSSATARFELHCVIKKLTISDHIDFPETRDERTLTTINHGEPGAVLLIEFFAANNNEITPLYRFDTLVGGKKDIFRDGTDYVEYALTSSIQKMNRINIEKALSGKKYKWEDITASMQQRFDLPILTQIPVRGVYLTFNDFKNNRVSYQDFTIDRNNKIDFIYVKNDKKQDELLRELWGYCDGRDHYIFSANNYFKLYRIGNTFKFYGAKGISQIRTINPLAARPVDLVNPNSAFSKTQTANKFTIIKKYLQLDMDTGNIY